MLLKLQVYNGEIKREELIEICQIKVDVTQVKSKEDAVEYEKTIGREYSTFNRVELVNVWPSDCYVLSVHKKGDLHNVWETIVTYNTGIFLCNEETGKTVDILSRKR